MREDGIYQQLPPKDAARNLRDTPERDLPDWYNPETDIFDPSTIKLEGDDHFLIKYDKDPEGICYLVTSDFDGNRVERRINRYPKLHACNARTRKGFCWGPIMGGHKKFPNGRCFRHKGSTFSAQFTNYAEVKKTFRKGMYAHVVPPDIKEFYLNNRASPELEKLLDELAILTSYIQKYLSASGGEDDQNLAAWREMGKKVDKLERAVGKDDPFVFGETMKEIKSLLKPKTRRAIAEKKVTDLIRQKSNVAAKQATIKRGEVFSGMLNQQVILTVMYGLMRTMAEAMIREGIEHRVRKEVLLSVALFTDTELFSRLLGGLAGVQDIAMLESGDASDITR